MDVLLDLAGPVGWLTSPIGWLALVVMTAIVLSGLPGTLVEAISARMLR